MDTAVKKSEMFCLNTTLKAGETVSSNVDEGVTPDGETPQGVVIIRLDNIGLTDEQATEIKHVHEHAVTRLREILWRWDETD